MDLFGALVLTAWALIWFFVCLFVGGVIFAAVAILITIEATCKYVGRLLLWRTT